VINRRNATLFKKGLTENLLRKGFIENPGNGVVKRRNGFGTTVLLEQNKPLEPVIEEYL
jgi:hypothetical protein